MIKHILDLLKISDHLGQSEAIEIAKGKFQSPKSIKEGTNKIKRARAWLKR